MADGVPITAGSGTTIATDDTGATGHVQLVKLAYSADGSPTLVSADSGGLLVNLGANNDVTVTGTVTAVDGGNSLTVDAPVGTPVFVRLSDGTSAITTMPVLMYPHSGLVGDVYTLTSKTSQWTSSQTSAALWTPASGKKLVITKLQIQAGGTVGGAVQVWFGASNDTSYTRGTDLALFDGEFAPSATVKPGVVMDGPWISSTADHVLKVASAAAINPLTVTVWGYEI